MPTDSRLLVETLEAILSVGHCDIVEEYFWSERRTGYRTSVSGTVVLDGQHMEAVERVLKAQQKERDERSQATASGCGVPGGDREDGVDV